jgi:hypothetical protein
MMKRVSLLLLFVFALFAVPARATTIYVSQTGGAFTGGTACNGQRAISVSTFKSTTLSAGETVYLCGTITSAVIPHNGGSLGSPVLVQWDSGASVQVCSTTAAVYINGLSYLLLDLGGNSTAIECPNNGIGLSTATDSVIGIGSAGNGWNNVEIRNGTVGPVFQYSGGTDNGFNTVCINGASGANNTYIHNLTLSGCAEGMAIYPTTNSTDQFAYLNVGPSVGRVLNYASGSSSNIALANSSFHDSSVNYTTVWAVPGDYEHYEAIHIYVTSASGAQDHITNFQIYNNYFYGSSPPAGYGATGLIFAGTGLDACPSTSYESVNIFDNLITDSGNSSTGFSDGIGSYFYLQDCYVTMNMYNNTVIAANGASNACFTYLETAGTAGTASDLVTFKNNICSGMSFAGYYFQRLTPFVSSNNDFYDVGAFALTGASGQNTYTLATWKTLTGQESNTITTIPGLSSTYLISSTSSAAYEAGVNLTSLGLTNLDTGAPATFGVSGACGTGCVARSSSGAWDLGAYPYASSASTANPPTNLTATPH